MIYLNAATVSGSVLRTSGCPTESRHRSAYKIQINSIKLEDDFQKTTIRLTLASRKKLTSRYPPLGIAFTSANFFKAAIASFNIGGVRKSVCRTSLLNEARFALNIKQKDPIRLSADVELQGLQP